MRDKPEISLVFPVYNGLPLLKLSVESVLAQKDVSCEFVIGDDNSTDGSFEFLQNIQDSRIKLIRNTRNLGLFGNLNSLIKASNSELIHLWSQDDIMMPDCLLKTVLFHQRNPGLAYAFSKYLLIDSQGNEIGKNEVTQHQLMSVEGHAITSLVTGSAPGNIANVSFYKQNIEEVGYFDEKMKYAGDFDMWCRLTQDKPVGIIQEYLIKLRSHNGQLSRNPKMWIYRLKENKLIYREFMKRIPEHKIKYVKRGLSWRIYTQYVGILFKLIRMKKIQLAKQYFMELNSQKSIVSVVFNYSILLVARKLGVHRKLLSKIYYDRL